MALMRATLCTPGVYRGGVSIYITSALPRR